MNVQGFTAALLSGAALIACAPAGAADFQPLSIHTGKGVARFRVEIADDAAERERGLMFREKVPGDEGMLFVFDDVQPRSFWMKNTLVPLDIIFISAGGRIVSIAENATPLSEASIPSAAPAKYVVELRGGRAAEIGAERGDRVVSARIR